MKLKFGTYYHIGCSYVTGTGGPCANTERGETNSGPPPPTRPEHVSWWWLV